MYRVLINRPSLPTSRMVVKDAQELSRLTELILTLETGHKTRLNSDYVEEDIRDEALFSYDAVVFRVKAINGKP